MKPVILCMADVSACPDALDPVREIADVRVFPADRDVLLREIASADAYFATLHVRADAELFGQAGRLRVIATPSTGTDHIDIELAAKRGIVILGLKHEREFLDRITATAELAWLLFLACSRRLAPAFEAARHGRWTRDEFRGHQVSGKTFGVLGYGRLGAMVAGYAKAFRMRVLACDIRDFHAEGVRRVSKEDLFRHSDAVSIHVHLAPDTVGLVGRKELFSMKRGAILINTSRGAVVDEAALLEALESGHLLAAGLDVVHGEWSGNMAQHPLIRYAREHDNLIITPHVGGVTFESQAAAIRYTAEKLREFLLG